MNFRLAEQIRAEYADRFNIPVTQSQLAIKYKSSQSSISKILNNEIHAAKGKRIRKPYQSVTDKLLALGLVKLTVWVKTSDTTTILALDQSQRFF
jgi:hypothetical protein